MPISEEGEKLAKSLILSDIPRSLSNMENRYTSTITEIKKIPVTNLIFLILLTLYEPISMIMSIKMEKPVSKNIKSVK